MKSVILIAPRAKNKSASDISVIKTPLSGILILGTMLRDKGYSVKMYDKSFKTPNYANIDADFVLITSMSATVNSAYELGNLYLEKGSKVFMGGSHVTFEPDEAIKHCNRVVLGEGENVLFSILNDKSKKLIIKGSPVLDLNTIPIPDYNLVECMKTPKNVISLH